MYIYIYIYIYMYTYRSGKPRESGLISLRIGDPIPRIVLFVLFKRMSRFFESKVV